MIRRILAPAFAATLLVTGCLNVPLGASIRPEAGAIAEGSAILQLQPEIRAGGLRTQAVVSPYGIGDIEALKLSLYKLDGQGNETPLLDAQGQTLTLSLTKSQLGEAIRFSKLHADTTYRVKAQAYSDAQATQLISTADAGSQTDVAIQREDRPTLAKLKVQLIDKTFDGEGSSTLDVATGSLTPAGSESITVVDPIPS